MSPLTGMADTDSVELDEVDAAYVASPAYCAEIGCLPVSQKVTEQVAVRLASFWARQLPIGLPPSEKVTAPVGAGAPALEVGVDTVADMVVRRPCRICLATWSASEVWVVPAAAGAVCGSAANAMATPTLPASAVASKKRSARPRAEIEGRASLPRRRNPAKPRVLEF